MDPDFSDHNDSGRRQQDVQRDAITLPLGIPSYRITNKKRISESTDRHSENNIPIFKGQKKLNIQLTRSYSHTNYRCFESTKEPKSLALLRLLHFILTKTALKFRNMLYEQITERTMRTTCAQNYVIITMRKLEIKFLAISRLQPLKWWRYIDDILTNTFITVLFSLTSETKFTRQPDLMITRVIQ